MRYLLLISVLAVACGESSPPPAAPGGEGGPIDVAGANGRTGGSGGGAGAGGIGGAGGRASGACDNPSDLEALAIAGSVRDVARDCGSDGSVPRCNPAILRGSAYEACVSSCVDDDVQALSSECAECYGALERCNVDSFCLFRCQNDTCSPICLSCVQDAGCIDEFETCRGIAGTECPE